MYDDTFFHNIGSEAESSASVIVPMVQGIVEPSSVLDVGCGTGHFAQRFEQQGCRVMGVDGSRAANLVLSDDQFEVIDVACPFDLQQQFDLVVSLEVGEHIHQPAAAEFVANLVRHGPVVLFSAAVPFQGGEGHVNEQWPDYWIWQFQQHGYVGSGFLRFRIWGSPEVSYWYQQNLMLFIDSTRAGLKALEFMDHSPFYANWRFVHPDLLGSKMGVKFT